MRVVIKLECCTGCGGFFLYYFFLGKERLLLLLLSIFLGCFSICVFPIKMKATRTQVVSFLSGVPLDLRSVACCCYASFSY